MKRYFLLSLLLFFITGCSLEIGNEYDDKRLPVDNKTYLSKQKRERLVYRTEHNQEQLRTKRYKFVDSERPVLVNREVQPVYPEYEEEFSCEGLPPSECEEKQSYYANYRTETRGVVIKPPREKHSHRQEVQKEHRPEGEYSMRRKEKTVRIKPASHNHKVLQKSVVPATHHVKSNSIDVKQHQKPYKTSKSKLVQHLPHEHHPSSVTTEASSNTMTHTKDKNTVQVVPSEPQHDDEGVPTIPPKIVLHDHMKQVPALPTGEDSAVQHEHVNKFPMIQPGAPHTQLSSPDLHSGQHLSTVKEANDNIASIRSQIEAKHAQDKNSIQQHVSTEQDATMRSANDEDMNAKLTQLQKLTSHGKELKKYTPKFPGDNTQNIKDTHAAQKKVSSQEVHLALNSNSENTAESVDEPVRSNMPPPVDLSQ